MRSDDTYGRFILGYFRDRIADAQLAEDLTQEFWVHVYQRFRIEQFQQLGLLKNKARQLLIDELRKRKVRDFVEPKDELPDHPDTGTFAQPGTEQEEAELFNRFWEQFPGIDLEEQQKRVFWLKERYGYTLNEISKELGVATSTAHDWLRIVRVRCSGYLNQEDKK